MKTNLSRTTANYMFAVTEKVRKQLLPSCKHFYFFDKNDLQFTNFKYSGVRVNTFYKNCRIVIKNYLL